MNTHAEPIWSMEQGDDVIVAAAIHDGHAVREEVLDLLSLSEADRLREEDPFTGALATIAANRIVGLRSRFEVDLNRTRDRAVYLSPDDAWGLTVWKNTPPAELIERSRAAHSAFYHAAFRLLKTLERNGRRFVVLDLHSYNHRRNGPDAAPADPAANPEVNLGTGTMDRARWAPLVDRFLADLRSYAFMGRRLDVRENVKFQGGYFPRFIHTYFPESGCALAIEFKKVFMDEWTGALDAAHFEALRKALQSTLPGLREVLSSGLSP